MLVTCATGSVVAQFCYGQRLCMRATSRILGHGGLVFEPHGTDWECSALGLRAQHCSWICNSLRSVFRTSLDLVLMVLCGYGLIKVFGFLAGCREVIRRALMFPRSHVSESWRPLGQLSGQRYLSAAPASLPDMVLLAPE